MTLFVTLLALLLAAGGYMTAWFGLARWTNRTDLVDSAWGLGFVYMAWLALALSPHHTALKVLAALFVTLWGVRLFWHITSRNLKKTEDYRYVAYREKWKGRYWTKAYLRIFLTQGLLFWVISFTSIAVMTATRKSWVWLAVVGFIVWGVGIGFEAVGDWQLRQFIKTKKPGQIMTKGLWAYSRHPNYFGEVTAWWGAAIVAVSYQQYWGIIGAAIITFLITKVSGIPPLEKHYADNKAFQAYAKHTPVLIPRRMRK